MSALTAHVRRLAASGATRSEIVHKMKADGFSEGEVLEVVDRILVRTEIKNYENEKSADRARGGVTSIVIGGVLLLIGFASLVER